jgi:hypothetical protein
VQRVGVILDAFPVTNPSPIGADIPRQAVLLLLFRNRFDDGPALQLESDPEVIGEHGPPLSIWKAPRNVAATIVIVAPEDQTERLALGMSFHATYFQAAGGTHYWNYEDCRTLGLQL